MRYRAEIDGLRAIAVLPVILFHAGFPAFSGGYVGVDIFFVISGYLITSIIVDEKKSGRFSLAHFYERRARRILPPLFLVMLCCLPFAWWWMVPDDLKHFSRSLIAVSLFTSNMMFGHESGYFDTAAALKPLLHTWSLAIEEQYYLCFPLLLMLLWPLGTKRIAILFAIIAAASLLFAEHAIVSRPEDVFYLLPARIWELLLGVLASFYPRERIPKNLAEFLALGGIALIGYAILCFKATTPFPGFYALIPTLGAALILLCAIPKTIVGKMLSSKPLAGIGLISYGAYLWHQPLFAFARLEYAESAGTVLLLALIILSLLLAYVSWRFVEKPFRNPAKISRKKLIACALTGSIFFIITGSIGGKNGFEQYYVSHRLNSEQQALYALIKHDTAGSMYDDMGDNKDCNFWVSKVDNALRTRFDACHKKYGPAVIMLGDSHAMNVYNALYRANFMPFFVGISHVACRPYGQARNCPYSAFASFLAEEKEAVKYVLFNESGAHLLRDYLGREDSGEVFVEGRAYSVDYGHIQQTADYLASLSPYAKIIWLGPFAEARFDFRNLKNITPEEFRIKPHTIAIFRGLDNEMAQILAPRQSQFQYVSLEKILHTAPEFLKQGNCVTYRDHDHWSVCGEKIAGTRIAKKLRELE